LRCDRVTRISIGAALVAVAVVAAGRPAHAFNEAAQFFDQPNTPHAATQQPSAEGIYFTGSPRFAGLTCSACHVDAPQRVRLRIGADDPTLFAVGYSPGKSYTLEVELLDETKGIGHNTATCTEAGSPGAPGYVPCNNNGFVLEIDAGATPLKGGFCAVGGKSGASCPMPNALGDEVVVAPGGDAVLSNRAHDVASPRTVLRNGQTKWRFGWTAPAAGTGPLTIFVAAVDGDGGGGTADDDRDPEGDDVVEGAIPIAEAGALPPDPATVSCGVARPGGAARGAGAAMAVGAAAMAWLLARARRRRAGAIRSRG